MRAAIYARRSKEEQSESLKTQVDGARRFIAERGWTVDDANIFAESGSRAEFVKRRGVGAMLSAAKQRAFDVLVVRDETRLGGDMLRTGVLIQDLAAQDVRLMYYATGEEVRADDSTSRLVMAVKNYSAELEREKISSRTRERLERNARGGLVAGGAVYGYRIVAVSGGKRWKIEPAEAEVIRVIFDRYAAVKGLRAIAKDLNARGVSPPCAGLRGTGSWSYSSIRDMLRREMYRGILVWGRRSSVYRGGTRLRVVRPESDWVTIELPELRIVSDELWEAVRGREAPRVRVTGSRARGAKPRYLLTGIGRCAECGGRMGANNGKVSHTTVRVYACSNHRDRGTCENGLRRPVAAVDQAVIGWLRDHVLREEIILDALRELRRRLKQRTQRDTHEVPELERAIRTVRAEIDRLASSLLGADVTPHAVVRMIAEREQRLADLEARLAMARTAPMAHELETKRLEKDAGRRLGALHELMGRNPDEARKVLETVLGGPLRFVPIETPEGKKRYRIEGEVALDRMVAAETGVCSTVGVPSGARTVLHTLEGARLPWACVA